MKENLKQKISQLVNDEIQDIVLTHSGYLSQGYKIVGSKSLYFARKTIPGMNGFEFPLDSQKCFVISDLMINNAGIYKSYGVLDIDGEIYHITDFLEGGLCDIKDIDDEILDKICDKIALIHNNGKKIVSKLDDAQKSMFYKRSFREILTNNETLFMVYEGFVTKDSDSVFFENLIKKMLDVYFDCVQNIDFSRITCLHGDFWNGNILIDKNKNVSFIDFSRILYGEPGIDIGRFLGQFDTAQIIGDIDNAQHLKKRFLDRYIDLTGDKDIEKYIRLTVLWVFYVSLSPMAQQFLKRDENKMNSLKKFAMEY